MPSYGVGVVPKMVFHRNKIHADQRTDSVATCSAYELSHELPIKLGLKQRCVIILHSNARRYQNIGFTLPQKKTKPQSSI